MSNVFEFRGVPKIRRNLARMLRELADVIEADQSETEPHGILMCLMGATQFEVIGIGDMEGRTGAVAAMNAVNSVTFNTEGGNIRKRGHAAYSPRPKAKVTPLVISTRGGDE